MSELHLLRPMWLWVLVPVFLVWWGLWRRQDRMAGLRKTFDSHLLDHLIVDRQEGRRLDPIHLTLLVWVLAVVALSGPTWEREPSPFADDNAGLMVLMKASETMLAEDVQPSRLERARHKLSDLLDARDGSATGLVVYSGSAHLVMPLTRDGRIVKAMASELSPDLMPENGDDLVGALEVATRVLDRAGVPGSIAVFADVVAPGQMDRLSEAAAGLPVQFLSLRPAQSPPDPGMQDAARALGARVIPLSIDAQDVEALAARASSDFRSTATSENGDRWKDAGFLLVPVLAILGLFWSRKGWVVT